MKPLQALFVRYPKLSVCEAEITKCAAAMIDAYEAHKKILVCGNGGSSSDADHIVGELMKGFCKKRELDSSVVEKLNALGLPEAQALEQYLQMPLRAINLAAHSGFSTAFINDVKPELVYAQQVLGYADAGDIYLGLSTSGSSKNVLYGAVMAKALGAVTLGLTGQSGCGMDGLFDIVIHAPAVETFQIQEYHLPIYHALCLEVENHFFKS